MSSVSEQAPSALPADEGSGASGEGAHPGGAVNLEHAVLGFDAKRQEAAGAQAEPTSEELGNPSAAQERAAEKRRQEALLEAKLREPHEGGTIFERHGTGTTPYSHRLRHQVRRAVVALGLHVLRRPGIYPPGAIRPQI